MEMNTVKPDSHVAQQSRRERLRTQHHFQELNNDNLEWPTAINYPVQNPDRNVRNSTSFVYDPALISSDMINFLTNSQRDASFIATGHDSHQQSNDWMLNYAIGGGGSQNPMISSGVMMPNNARVSDNNDTLMHQSSSWGHDWNERGVDLPNFGNQSSGFNFDAITSIENLSHQRTLDMAIMARKGDEHDQQSRRVSADPNTQRLSLSLSHNSHFSGAYESHDSIPKPSIISRGSGKSLNETGGVTNPTYRCTGPLGPFTGYATILKCSKFLLPAQELLDEFCSATGTLKTFDRRVLSGEVCSNSLSGPGVNKSRVVTKVDEVSVVSSSTYHSSNEVAGDCGIGCSNSDLFRPEYQQTKAKLICLQEEVCRKYKQYHQQMQMVVSSFESVSGLRAASPYISMAIKSVSRNFRGLKNAILDQLRHIGKVLGEDLLCPTTGASSSDGNLSKLKYTDKSSFQNQKSGGGNVGFGDPQCVWRSQRGLPERSVAVLRAWLFEHFLHPYPTDTDKHMLAAQTGLTRNQVSNWFINARVRIWKPMVEEIHNLENSRVTEPNKNSHDLTDEKSTAEGTSQNNKFNMNTLSEKQLEFPEIRILGNIGSRDLGMEQWNQGKHGDCEVPALMTSQSPALIDGNSLMGAVPYQQRSGLEISGLGAVSLTLELRHGVESVQQQQLLQQEDQLRNQFHFVDRLN